MLPPMKWNAWGDPAAAKPLSDGIRTLLKQALGVDGATDAELEPRAGAAAPVRADGRRPRRAGRDRRRRLLRRRRPRPAAARRRQVDAGPVAPQGYRRPGCARRGAPARRRRRGRRAAAVLRASTASRSSRSAAAPASSAASTRSAATSRPWSRWTCAASTQLHALDEVSGEAELGAGRHRPGGRAPARRARLLARPLPAELPVRHHRRIRRDPVLRPGLRGLRPLRRHGPRTARGDPGGRARPRPRPGVRRRPRPAAAVHRLGGRVRDHHPGAGAGAPGPRDHPLRGVVVPRLRDRRRRAARRRPDRRRPDRDPAVRRGRDRRQPGHHREHRRSSRSPVAAWRSPRSRAPRRTPRAGTPRPARCCRPHGGTSLGEAPARAWEHGRFDAPYLRDSLLAAGALCETLETATNWSNLRRAQGGRHRGADRSRSPNPAHRHW